MYLWVAITAALAVFLSSFQLEEAIYPVSESPTSLSDATYRYEQIHAPVLAGWKLKLFSYIFTQTPFVGPILRRKLLLRNHITKIRQLASQVDPSIAVLHHHPIHRLDANERKQHDEIATYSAHELRHFILHPNPSDSFLTESSVNEISPFPNSRVLQYYRAYVDPSNFVTPSIILNRTMEAILKLQPIYHPFLTWPPSPDALKTIIYEADLSSRRFAAHKQISIWDGVPVTFKACIDIKGYITTEGSQYYYKTRSEASSDDDIVKIFRSLGAIILPPLNMVENGVSPIGYNAYFSGPFNPYNASHYSGGSSSGSAVAVALGISPISIGFDGGGSIRTPASFSGVVGFAMGYGRADATSLSYKSSMLKTGPLAATIADAALVYATITTNLKCWESVIDKETNNGDTHENQDCNIMGSFDTFYDGGVLGLPRPHLNAYFKTTEQLRKKQTQDSMKKDLNGTRIGIFYPWFSDAEPSVVHACNEALQSLVQRGAQVVNISIPHISVLRLAHALIIAAEFSLKLDIPYHNRIHVEYLEPTTRITAALGRTTTGLDILASEKLRAWAFHYVNTHIFSKQGVDVIITPTVPLSAPPIHPRTREYGESNTALQTELLKYVFLANFIGLPSISVPFGYNCDSGLPISVMFTGPQWREDTLLSLASFVELDAKLRGIDRRPPDYLDVLAIIN